MITLNTRSSLAALVFALPLGATSAFAGSLEEPVVAVVPVAPAPYVSLWSGGYVGAQAGYAWADTDITNNSLNGINDDGDGWLGGAFVGYRGNANKFVYGAEASYDFADVQLDNNNGSIDGLGRLKVIGGYDLGKTLVYATAGAAYGDGDINNKSHADWGWLAGAGVDYMVNDQWSVGAEALYQDFGQFGDSGTDLELTTLEARVSYHF